MKLKKTTTFLRLLPDIAGRKSCERYTKSDRSSGNSAKASHEKCRDARCRGEGHRPNFCWRRDVTRKEIMLGRYRWHVFTNWEMKISRDFYACAKLFQSSKFPYLLRSISHTIRFDVTRKTQFRTLIIWINNIARRDHLLAQPNLTIRVKILPKHSVLHGNVLFKAILGFS